MGTFSPDQLAQLALFPPEQAHLLQAFHQRCRFAYSLIEELQQAGLTYARLQRQRGVEARRAAILRAFGAAYARLLVERDALQIWLDEQAQAEPALVSTLLPLLTSRGLWPLPVPPLPADVAQLVAKARSGNG